ncbi:ORF1a [Torque teno neovison virus]|nr:ORF1a [Torque teno neovison virus]
MAWIPRSQWIRKRFGNWKGRARTFRRRYYNRYWFNKRRGGGHRRRRQLPTRRQRVRGRRFIIRQYHPKFRRPCTIRGWLPFLFCLTDAPFFRPMYMIGDLNTDRSGGWTVTELTLEGFYKENKLFRNLWSTSNCDFDLAQYRGTYLTLYPTQWIDYIVWWDTDYGNYNEFAQAVKNIHPAVLINKPNTTVVLPKGTRGTYKPKKIFLPPPKHIYKCLGRNFDMGRKRTSNIGSISNRLSIPLDTRRIYNKTRTGTGIRMDTSIQYV